MTRWPLDTSMIGKKFGKWTIVEYGGTTNHQKRLWTCKCECGSIRKVSAYDMKVGKSTQCFDCYSKNGLGRHLIKHGMSHTPIYRIWHCMVERCTKTYNKDYSYYGGRGITVDDDWLSFQNFYRDMGERPEGKQLDRRDNNLGYSKNNCHWITPKENCANRRRSGRRKSDTSQPFQIT